jgi:hypothetical protein
MGDKEEVKSRRGRHDSYKRYKGGEGVVVGETGGTQGRDEVGEDRVRRE